LPALPPWLESARRWIVLALIVAHIVAISIMAFPSPGGGLNRRDWKQPTVQAEFDAWNERLRAFGWTGTSSELQDELYGIARSYASAHHQLKKPFYRYYECCGTAQSWRMFVAPHMHPSRFQLRIRQEKVWYVIYEARDPDHRWMGHVLDHDRMRSVLFRYGWGKKYPKTYEQLGDWLARHAAVDFPDAEVLQVRYASYRSLSPEQVRSGERPKIRWQRSRIIQLGPFRGETPGEPVDDEDESDSGDEEAP